ncbi:MAG: hypothetical protein JNL41_08110 [Phenylobacterium sp.]|uniref:DUF7662 domain-containing protein n=1 Tax=Phenylobacterium sp. TaxID=1871053 RepID=UPI001A5FA9B5|nr:hypothetical protein [Phenylobacterium sp.]MBL8554227.1 hypothetical protein [Phenylobacterium sp.]
MAKYEPLRAFLSGRSDSEVPMTFGEIESIIAASLPPVAFKHRAWWSNNPSNSVITHAWLEAGYKTEQVDMGSQKLVFRRSDAAAAARPGPREAEGAPRNWLDELQARMAGTVQVEPGWDLTRPTGEVWDAERG